MLENHKEQINAKIADSLAAAGVGKAYHHRQLSELADGELLKTWLFQAGRIDVRTGKGWTILGKGSKAYDTAILLGRALHLKGLKTRIVPLRKLVSQLSLDDEADYADCDVLVVLDFVQQYRGNPAPLTGKEVQVTEQFLNARLDNYQSVFVHSAVELESESSWWSPTLIKRISDANRVVNVA